VIPATITSIGVTPAGIRLAQGNARQYVATATYSDSTTQDVTRAVAWSSSDLTVAAIDGTARVSALSPGTVTITAIDRATGISGSTALTVTRALMLRSITVRPAAISLELGSTQPFTALASFDDGSSDDITTQVSWGSSDTSIASISNDVGTEGLLTTIAAGIVTITATDPATGISGSATATVKPFTLTSIAIAPDTAAIPAGTTQTFVATGTFSDGSTRDLSGSVGWISSAPAIATVTGGVATGLAAGSATITARDPTTGVSGAAALTVTPATLVSVAVRCAASTLPLGGSTQCTAMGAFSDGGPQRDITQRVTWASSDPSAVSLSNATGSSGLATALATGTSTITATDPSTGASDSTVLNVTRATVTSITITPASATTAAGLRVVFTAQGTYSDGGVRDVTHSATWTATPDGIVVDIFEGYVDTYNTGTVTITASDPTTGVHGTATLTIMPAVVTGISIQPSPATVDAGSTAQLQAFAVYSTGTMVDITSSVTWKVGDSSIATVSSSGDSAGQATGVSSGWTTVTASDPASGKSGTADLGVAGTFLSEAIFGCGRDPDGSPANCVTGAAVAVDSSNTPFVAYTTSVDFVGFYDNQLTLMRRAGGATPWVSDINTPIDEHGQGWTLRAPSMAMSTLGVPCAAVQQASDDALLLYCRSGPNDWPSTGLEPSTIGVSGPLSLAFDNLGHAAVVFVTASGLSYYRDGATETILAAGSLGSSLAFSPSGPPHVAYLDTNGNVMHAKRGDAGWTTDSVLGVRETGRCVSVAVDSSGAPHVLYADESSSTFKIAALTPGGTWASTDTGSGFSASQYSGCLLRIDAADRQHVIVNGTWVRGFNLHGVLHPGKTWLWSNLPGPANDLAVDAIGRAHLVWWNSYGVAYLHE
jgi:hypothetical protein